MRNNRDLQLGMSLVLMLLIAISCSKKINIQDKQDELTSLQAMMTGSYDSSAQAAQDSAYYNISLHMYPIWTNRRDGKYLYVEQALASMQDKPYRQRIYKLEKRDDGTIASHVYKLRNDSLYIGMWKTPSRFDSNGLSLLEIREGCEVVLQSTSDGYAGSTVDQNCKSSLRGASYATSIVSMTPAVITSWDQGFDDKGEQVWGAVSGPYIFRKIVE